MPRSFLIFVHVPKTGGSTFKQILERNFRGRYQEEYSAFWEPAFTPKQLSQFIHSQNDKEALSSHRLNLNLPFEDPGIDLTAIAFIRDPVERVISQYFFNRNNRPGLKDPAKEMSLAEYVDYGLKQKNLDWLIDGQFKFLTRDHGDVTLDSIEKLAASRKLLLFPLEAFDTACLILERRFPRWFTDATYVLQNVSIRDQSVSEEIRNDIRLNVPKDFRLHEMARKQLDELCEESFDTGESIDSKLRVFRSRCVRRKFLIWAPRRAGGIVLRKLRILN